MVPGDQIFEALTAEHETYCLSAKAHGWRAKRKKSPLEADHVLGVKTPGDAAEVDQQR